MMLNSMWYVALVTIVSSIPYIWLLWSLIDQRRGHRERLNWKGPLAAFISILAVSIVVNGYLKSHYGYTWFPNPNDLLIVGIVVGVFAFAFGLIFWMTHVHFRDAPKSVHDPGLVSVLLGGILVAFTIAIIWYYPIGEKLMHIQFVEHGAQMLEERLSESEEISVVLVSSSRECLRYSNQSCRSSDFKNLFLVQNNLDEKVEVQLKIRALNERGEEIKMIDSDILTLQPEEPQLVITPETHEKTSNWKQRSFYTKEPIYQYQYLYRYRSPNE